MVLTLRPLWSEPNAIPNFDESSSINFAFRILDRLDNVIVDFGKMTDVLSYSDSHGVDGGSGRWTLRLKATSDNINLLKSLHPGLCVEFYCARNNDPTTNVIRNPALIKRKDSTPELPNEIPPSLVLPSGVGGATGPIPASLNAFFGITNDADLYRLAVVAMTEGKPNSIVSQIDSAVSIGNRVLAGKWGKTASAVVSAPQQYEAWTRFGLQGVSDRTTAIAALNKNGRSAAQLDSFLAALRNPSTVQNSVEHLKGSTDYRAYVPGVTSAPQAGDPQRSSDDNYYIPGGTNQASVSASEAAQLYRGGQGAVRNSNVSTTTVPTQAPSEKVSVSSTGGDPTFAGKVIMQRTGTKDSQGLENLKLTVYDRSGKPISEHTVNSGIADMQRFGTGSVSGSKAPVDFGQYRIGQPIASGEEGVGRTFIPVDPTADNPTTRTAIGFHVDADRDKGIATATSGGRGSAGCIVFSNEADFAKFQTALQQSGAEVFEFLKEPKTAVTTQNGTQTTTASADYFPDVKPENKDPYGLDAAPYLLLRGIISEYGRDTNDSSVLTISGSGFGKLYEDSQVLVDINSPELQSRAFEIRAATQRVEGVTLSVYRLLRQWTEAFFGEDNGWQAIIRQLPFPPNYLTRINQGGSVWNNLKALSIDGFFHMWVDHRGAICWEKLCWSRKSQSLIAGRNWEDNPIFSIPSWTIVDWNDRLSERGLVNFLRCTQSNAGQSTNYAASIYNAASIAQYGGPTKREILFPIGTQGEQYFTSEPRRKEQATVTSFLSLAALEAIRWMDRPIQNCGITMRGDAFLRSAMRIEITEDWHNAKAKPGEYYIISRSHSIDLANGSWTTSLETVRDRSSRYLGIGVGSVPIVEGLDGAEEPKITETTSRNLDFSDWTKSPIFTTGASGTLQKKPTAFPEPKSPELSVSLPSDRYWFFDRITGQYIEIGNDPISYARKEVIPNLDKPSKLPPPEVKLPKAGTGSLQTGAVATPAGKLPSPFASGIWVGSVFDPAGRINSRGRPHKGVDLFPAREGDDNLLACWDGVVTVHSNSCPPTPSFGCGSGFGNWITIALSGEWSGWEVLFGHMAKIYVSSGQSVRRGAVVGLMGDSGSSGGPHLHIELRKGGTLVNPMRYLPAPTGTAGPDAGRDYLAGG